MTARKDGTSDYKCVDVIVPALQVNPRGFT